MKARKSVLAFSVNEFSSQALQLFSFHLKNESTIIFRIYFSLLYCLHPLCSDQQNMNWVRT